MLRHFSMRVTVDANVLFSCLIKDSQTRKLFFNPELMIFAPEFIVDELAKYVLEIKNKSGLSDSELLLLIDKVFGQIRIVPDKDLRPFLPAAASLISDPKDWLYLSCALSQDTSIWSNDAGFKVQNRVRTVTTKELSQIVGNL